MRHIMMLWNASDVIGGLEGALLWRDAVDAVAVKVFDGVGEQSRWDENIQFAAELIKGGIPIEAWGYCYGDADEPYVAKEQCQKLTLVAGAEPERLILDAEAEWERQSSREAWLDAALRSGDEPPAALSVMVIPMLPHRNRFALAAAQLIGDIVPMLYWKDFPIDLGGKPGGRNWRDWNTLIPDWERGPYGQGWLRPWRAAAVSFYAAEGIAPPTLEELEAFVEVLEGHGVETVYYWDWRGCPEEWWLRLREGR